METAETARTVISVMNDEKLGITTGMYLIGILLVPVLLKSCILMSNITRLQITGHDRGQPVVTRLSGGLQGDLLGWIWVS